MTWRKPGYSQTYPLLDPCAGEGEAIVTLRDLWAADLGSEGRRPGLPPFAIRACELEAQRAEALAERLEWQDRSFAGELFPAPAPDALHHGLRAALPQSAL